MSDDFCITHGYDHMRSQMGNPIPFCQACDEERIDMNTMEQIARDIREGTFPAKSEATLREEGTAARPSGSNADEWHLFLSEHLDNRANVPNGLTYMAVQIAEAIDAAADLAEKRRE